MKTLILLLCFSVSSISVVLAADTSCYYSDTSIIVTRHDTVCTPKDNGNSSCRFPLWISITSDCRKDVEIFYLCKISIESGMGGLFSATAKTGTDTIGSLVIHDGKGDGTLNVLWESGTPVKNVKVTQLNCFATDIYPLDEQQ